MGKGGEIYVLHMGDPVKIVELARDMITLSGLRPGVDVEITFTGKRPGEKLFEELSSEGEHIGDTAHPKIGIWKHRAEDWDLVHEGIERLMGMADSASDGQLHQELKRLVPEYTTEGQASTDASGADDHGKLESANGNPRNPPEQNTPMPTPAP